MKLAQCLALMALLLMIVVTSINCVQDNTPQPSASPSATPTGEPVPTGSLTQDQQLDIYNKAISDPCVKQLLPRMPGRTMQSNPAGGYNYSISFATGRVGYMTCHEIAPGIDRTRTLPAAEIIPGNASQAGVNMIVYMDTTGNRVAFVGFVPRSGAPVDQLTFSPVEGGVEGRAHDGVIYYNLRNVTVVDTGYTPGMSLTNAQIDQATSLAMTNATVLGYVDGHNAVTRDINVSRYESGYEHRYALTYPLVTIDVTDGITHYDTIFIWVDPVNNRVMKVEHSYY
jgi:hypothetical protein